MELSHDLVSRILTNIDAGLVQGIGIPVPGKMCVEAAICYSLGLPHGDDPGCVSPAVRALKIRLNDSAWSSDATRAAGMRRLAIAQLGTKEGFDDIEFAIRVSLLVYSESSYVIWANRWLDGSDRSESAAAWAAEAAAGAAAGAARAARAARAAAATGAAGAAWAAWAAAAWEAEARDEVLATFAENVVQILIAMKVPAVEFLP